MARMRPCHGRPSISRAVSSSWKFLSHCALIHSSLRPSCYTLCRPKCCFPHCRPISYQCRCPLFRPSPSRLLQSVMNCAKVLEMLKFSNGKAAALILEFEHINVQRVVYAQSKYSNMFMNFTFPIIAVSQDQFEFPREVIRSRLFELPSEFSPAQRNHFFSIETETFSLDPPANVVAASKPHRGEAR